MTQTPDGFPHDDPQPESPLPPEPAAPSMWPTPEGVAIVVPPAQATSSNAIVALVLSIAAWPICPVIFAIIALVFASKASKEIQGSGGRIGGQGYVTAARIVAWINIGFYVAILILVLLFGIIFVIAGGMSGEMTGF